MAWHAIGNAFLDHLALDPIRGRIRVSLSVSKGLSRQSRAIFAALFVLSVIVTGAQAASRIKDLVDFEGIREISWSVMASSSV